MTLPAPLRDFWRSREPRERRALAVLAVVLLAALLAQLAWLAVTEAPTLREQLAARRAELAHMRALADALPGTTAATAAPPPPAGQRVGLVAAQLAVAGSSLTARGSGDGRVEVNGTTDFDSLVGLIGRWQSELGLRAVVLDVGPAAGPGLVTVHLELAAP